MDSPTRRMDEIYRSTPPEEIPWNSKEPPEVFVELINSGKIKPGRTLDLGCGLGNYAIWLASRRSQGLAGCGFDVVGVDGSATAIKTARQKAKEKGVKCRFAVADITEEWPDLGKRFDFVYDWGLLHHIFPKKRGEYVENVHRVLRRGGVYLSVCFNEKDAAFEGCGKYRKTKFGGKVYLSSEKELRQLFGGFFKILDFRVLETTGKFMTPDSRPARLAAKPRAWRASRGGHIFNYCFMKRKDR